MNSVISLLSGFLLFWFSINSAMSTPISEYNMGSFILVLGAGLGLASFGLGLINLLKKK